MNLKAAPPAIDNDDGHLVGRIIQPIELIKPMSLLMKWWCAKREGLLVGNYIEINDHRIVIGNTIEGVFSGDGHR